MQKPLFFTLFLTVLALPACTSGIATKDAVINSLPPINLPRTGAHTSNKFNTVHTPLDGSNNPDIVGNISSVNILGANKTVERSIPIKPTNDINKVTIADQSIYFMPTDAHGVTATLAASDYTKVEGITHFNGGIKAPRYGGHLHLQNMRFGYLDSADQTMPHVFAQGIGSKSIPTSGKVSYEGWAVLLNSHFTPRGSGIGGVDNGKSEFTVNFDDKSLTGVISSEQEGVNKINLSAKINGTTFEGEKDGFTTQGNFFGENGQEIGGIYRNTDGSLGGAYGALQKPLYDKLYPPTPDLYNNDDDTVTDE